LQYVDSIYFDTKSLSAAFSIFASNFVLCILYTYGHYARLRSPVLANWKILLEQSFTAWRAVANGN